MPNDKQPIPFHRRALDRVDQCVLENERKLLAEVMRFGVPTFDLVMNLSLAYMRRARERVKRGTATPQDEYILRQIGVKPDENNQNRSVEDDPSRKI